jgi:hypothetical protein
MARKRNQSSGTARILREYMCLAHGDFEAYEEVCPQGCTTVERRFYTAPAIRQVSRGIDNTLQTLANDYGMTDMRNDMGSVMESMRRGQSDFAPKWGAMGDNVRGSIGNAPPTDAITPMRDVLNKPKPLVIGNHRE